MDNGIILITAASKGTWLREKIDPRSWIRMLGEGFIDDYKAQMEVLREADDRIYEWTADLSDLAKEARIALKSNRLVDLAIVLKTLNDRLSKVRDIGSVVEQEVAKFEKQHELPLDKDILSSEDSLISQAGFFDRLKREWMADRLESKKRKERKLALRALVDLVNRTVNKAEETLKAMSKARALGNIGNYVDGLDKMSKIQSEFQQKFAPTYNQYLLPVVEQALAEAAKAEEAVTETVEEKLQDPKSEEVAVESVPVTNSEHSLPSEDVDLTSLEQSSAIPLVNRKSPESSGIQTRLSPGEEPPTELGVEPMPLDSIPANTEVVVPMDSELIENIPDTHVMTEPAPATVRSANDEMEQILLKKAHADFVTELLKEAKSNDPYLLAAMVVKYAGQIEEFDLDKSLKLLAIAEGILND